MTDRIVFDTELERAAWDDDAQVWRCRTTSGEIVARTLITGTGGLSAPRLPDIEGIDSFAGALFHSARWDHSVDLAGKRVAVVGTGASAIQIVPEVQRVAAHLDVYQRTAPWVIPRNDRRYPRLERLALRHVPALAKLYRTGIYWAHEGYVPAFTWQPRLGAPAEKAATINIKKAIKDPELRAQGHARPSSSAASGCCARTPTTPPSPARTSTSSPTRSPGSPRPGSSPVTGSSTRPT